jgi:hypothetical protein
MIAHAEEITLTEEIDPDEGVLLGPEDIGPPHSLKPEQDEIRAKILAAKLDKMKRKGLDGLNYHELERIMPTAEFARPKGRHVDQDPPARPAAPIDIRDHTHAPASIKQSEATRKTCNACGKPRNRHNGRCYHCNPLRSPNPGAPCKRCGEPTHAHNNRCYKCKPGGYNARVQAATADTEIVAMAQVMDAWRKLAPHARDYVLERITEEAKGGTA